MLLKIPVYDGVTDIYFNSVEDFDSFFTSENYKQKVQPDEANFVDIKSARMLVCNEKIIVA